MNSGTGRNRGRGRGKDRGRGSYSWRNLHDSPLHPSHTPGKAGASSNKQQISGSLDTESKHSWLVKNCNTSGVVSESDDSVTPLGHHDQARFGSNSDQHVSGSLHKKSYSSWQQVRGHNSYGAVLRNNQRATSAGYQGEQQGSSTFRGKYSFPQGMEKKFGSSHIEAKKDIKLDRSLIESVDHLAYVSPLSASVSRVEASVSTENELDCKSNEHTDCSSIVEAFDICPPKSTLGVTLKPSLYATNKEKRNQLKNSICGPDWIVLRSGMVHLKSYLSSSEQANILKICRNHGLGPAGFYQPLFREGAKLHLKMMCFGAFWDPETSIYGDLRPIDSAKPPPVPPEFLVFVDRAIKDSQSLIAESTGVKNIEKVLPSVKPDICLVNYYATTGRLGLHQDKDESQESLDKGIPIVSFSIGDAAEFLYGDESDADKAKKILLESGDVLIFGGKSRRIFHGVSTIKPETAPKSLLEGTNFRPGRLNLTFRQHF